MPDRRGKTIGSQEAWAEKRLRAVNVGKRRVIHFMRKKLPELCL